MTVYLEFSSKAESESAALQPERTLSKVEKPKDADGPVRNADCEDCPKCFGRWSGFSSAAKTMSSAAKVRQGPRQPCESVNSGCKAALSGSDFDVVEQDPNCKKKWLADIYKSLFAVRGGFEPPER